MLTELVSDPIGELEKSEKCRDWVTEAVKRSNGRQTFLTVAEELAQGRAQLWIVKDDEPQGLLMTDLQRYPTGALWLNVRMGTGSMEAMEAGIEAVKLHAQTEGLAGVEGIARPGWARIGKRHGFLETHRFLEWAHE